jgi:hypothetical protein
MIKEQKNKEDIVSRNRILVSSMTLNQTKGNTRMDPAGTFSTRFGFKGGHSFFKEFKPVRSGSVLSSSFEDTMNLDDKGKTLMPSQRVSFAKHIKESQSNALQQLSR